MRNPALASIIAAAPIGLISIMFIEKGKLAECYIKNYILTTIVHTCASLVLYLLLVSFSVEKTKAALIALFAWFMFQLTKYYCIKTYFSKIFEA